MSAIVLCDGEAASLKSIEIGGVAPGLFIFDHIAEELILLHVWSVANQYSMLSALNAKKASLQEEQQQQQQQQQQPQQQYHEELQKENAANDIFDMYSSVVNDTIEKKNAMQHVAEVVQKSLAVINEHKLLKSSLLYTIETARVEPEFTNNIIDECNKANVSEKTQEKSEKMEESENHDNTESDDDAINAIYLHIIKNSIATTLTHHVRERAIHYETLTNRKPVIMCGAGNNTEGRQIQIGSVAHAVWSEMRNEYELCFVKAEGSTWKPRANRVRYMVVIPLTVEVAQEHLQKKKHEESNCLTLFLHLISQTMQRRRAMSNNTVSVLLLVESNVKEQVVEEFTAAINNLLLQTDKEINSNNKAETDDVQEENATQQLTDEKTSFVQTIYLKGNKSNNNSATFANSETQLTKLLHQHCKCEFVIIDAEADKSVQMVLLALSKPHCIVTPHSKVKKLSQ